MSLRACHMFIGQFSRLVIQNTCLPSCSSFRTRFCLLVLTKNQWSGCLLSHNIFGGVVQPYLLTMITIIASGSCSACIHIGDADILNDLESGGHCCITMWKYHWWCRLSLCDHSQCLVSVQEQHIHKFFRCFCSTVIQCTSIHYWFLLFMQLHVSI